MSLLKQTLFLAKQTKITSSLVVINVAYFIISRMLDSRGLTTHDNAFLIDWGADVAQLTFSGQYWRMFTNLFVHISVTHLAMNMLALWSVGSILERVIPPFAFLGIYFLSGLYGSLASDIATINVVVISCGASGAILGIITAFLAFSLVNHVDMEQLPIKSIIVSLVLTAAIGLLPSIDNMAHIGGAVTGFILGGIVSACLRKFKYSSSLLNIIIGIIFIIAAVGLYLAYLDYLDYQFPANYRYYY
ncbi:MULTISPECIES: rhomboid family intramembrane serine protease [unclassified Gilliamella]|uniref:rhomboid family intramembrane serine protease n=1 Tax=unclassified Gilliamella TaxID=2685620 RepID=UPI002269C0FD|nr:MULTISPECIES: rhomboid family intramembrane serine protease [unclassified Gilliamella]MCX8602272.1 rhomboid family intramembrane serine protease [Gilliamella sp. B3722]MCX8608449.1 rhomboid family intramembrane serine protease [Gilliamella sp. B3771]MCX8611566.1 rhomboid family intramembrane serine protease [Gilliamella sp. B3891]MCX8614033.1 rhomboid family intramembrane serine protease [Gilliamella sp. B3773]MCX8616457.1 rhomboid family intramembrane serine protease [Gilliamella sp. B3770